MTATAISTSSARWVLTSERPWGVPCIKHAITNEYCLAGRYGQIYESRPGELVAIITNHELGNQLFPFAWLYPGEEISARFCVSELQEWMNILKVPKQRPLQIRYAEEILSHVCRGNL